MLNADRPGIYRICSGKNSRGEFGEKWISRSIMPVSPRDNLLMRMKDEEWNDIIETNLSSVFSVCQKSGNARYDEKASWSYYHYQFLWLVMGMAVEGQLRCGEAGLIGFSGKSLAREVASRGNYCKRCCSGALLETDMTRALSDDQRAGIPRRFLRVASAAHRKSPTRFAFGIRRSSLHHG